MAADLRSCVFTNGFWSWDNLHKCLQFTSRDVKDQAAQGARIHTAASGLSSQSSSRPAFTQIKFRGTIDNLEQAKFRRYCQRRVRPNEPEVITIQDIKDIALFTANPNDLIPEFINFFHTEMVDKFLRALVVYFQYYFQVWDNMLSRREEAKRKLRQPIVTVLEDVIRNNLADLRSVVARNYSYIMLGLCDVSKFYHMKGRNSLSDKDRRLCECLFAMIIRTVWIALQRKNFTLIGHLAIQELIQGLFNPIERDETKRQMYRAEPGENRILLGQAYALEKKLKHRSPAVQEIIFQDHDYRMLVTGVLQLNLFDDDRLKYIEAAFTLPEEHLQKMNIKIGLLGYPREAFDVMLMNRDRTKLQFKSDSMLKETDFNIPEKNEATQHYIRSLHENRRNYIETVQTVEARKRQNYVWQKYILNQGAVD